MIAQPSIIIFHKSFVVALNEADERRRVEFKNLKNREFSSSCLVQISNSEEIIKNHVSCQPDDACDRPSDQASESMEEEDRKLLAKKSRAPC